MTFRNVSRTRVTFKLRCDAPFSVDRELWSLEHEEAGTALVRFDPEYRGDRISHEIRTALRVEYVDVPVVDEVFLGAEVRFPNLALDVAEAAFGAVLNDTTERRFVTLRNDRSHSTFSRLAWFTSRLDLPEGVQRFSPLDNGDSSAAKHLCDTACPRCAPQPPKLEWVRRAGEKKLEAREDPREAATFEQSLKRRPAPFVVQWRKQSAKVTSPSKKGKGAESPREAVAKPTVWGVSANAVVYGVPQAFTLS